MSEPIRIGILSFAHYHANFWSEVFRDSPDADFIGVWDDDRARGMEAAERFGTRYWPELAGLLDRCDAVGVTSETIHHVALIEQAAAHGCHVLCEKPPARTLAECDRIEAAVARAGVTFMQSFPKRFDPVNHELRRLVQSGELGRIALMRVRHGHLYGLIPGHATGWIADPEQAGGGALLDEGIHGADLIRWLLGEPESVVAVTSNAITGGPAEDLGIAIFRFADGTLAELTSASIFAAAENSVEIFGSKGSAVLSGVDLASRDLTDGNFLKVCRLGEEPRCWEISPLVPRFKTMNFHQRNAIEFLKALRDGTPPAVTLEDGRRALQMILAAYEAAKSGAAVTIPPPRGAS